MVGIPGGLLENVGNFLKLIVFPVIDQSGKDFRESKERIER